MHVCEYDHNMPPVYNSFQVKFVMDKESRRGVYIVWAGAQNPKSSWCSTLLPIKPNCKHCDPMSPLSFFLSTIGWKQNGASHILVEKTSREEMTCVVVNKVNNYRLNCSPIGNYRKEYPPLSKAKFQLMLGR